MIELNWLRIEFKPQDFWVGVYWKRTYDKVYMDYLDIWVCIVPMFPIHINLRVGEDGGGP